MSAGSNHAVDGALGFVLATRDVTHRFSSWNNQYGFGPLFHESVFSEEEAIASEVPIADDEPEWLALPAPLGTEGHPRAITLETVAKYAPNRQVWLTFRWRVVG